MVDIRTIASLHDVHVSSRQRPLRTMRSIWEKVEGENTGERTEVPVIRRMNDTTVMMILKVMLIKH